ncbi:MAG: hypothetical protein U5K79_14550 [Cyclobacteriaceae bacterium]|nr:hypothetical protein [Cyclobacteriaceae bacterium]
MRVLYAFFTVALLVGCQQHKKQSESIPERSTTVSIEGENFHIDGQPTLQGVVWNGINMEGLLPNSRMVQGIFDDENPETAGKWAYPDTKVWSVDRNTDEFIVAMEQWYNHGLLAFTICLQGGSPEGYSKSQPWENNAFNTDGSLRLEYMNRLDRILKRADELGMVAIVGLFYFGQDQRLADEAAVKNATNNAINWLLGSGHRNLLIEIANECNNNAYDHEILKAANIHELIEQAKSLNQGGRRLLVGTSFNGNTLPSPNVVEVSDFILIHGNGVKQHERITEMVSQVRAMPEFHPMPIVFNEDDHFDFEQPMNNMIAAFAAHASWGYFDFRMDGEGFEDGYQSVPLDWGINSARKKAFFEKLKEITGK